MNNMSIVHIFDCIFGIHIRTIDKLSHLTGQVALSNVLLHHFNVLHFFISSVSLSVIIYYHTSVWLSRCILHK